MRGREVRARAAALALRAGGYDGGDLDHLAALCVFFEWWITKGGDETVDRFDLFRGERRPADVLRLVPRGVPESEA